MSLVVSVRNHASRRLRDDIVDDDEEEENFVVRVLEIISFCSEFDELPVRHNEELLNQELANRFAVCVPVGADSLVLAGEVPIRNLGMLVLVQ